MTIYCYGEITKTWLAKQIGDHFPPEARKKKSATGAKNGNLRKTLARKTTLNVYTREGKRIRFEVPAGAEFVAFRGITTPKGVIATIFVLGTEHAQYSFNADGTMDYKSNEVLRSRSDMYGSIRRVATMSSSSE